MLAGWRLGQGLVCGFPFKTPYGWMTGHWALGLFTAFLKVRRRNGGDSGKDLLGTFFRILWYG